MVSDWFHSSCTVGFLFLTAMDTTFESSSITDFFHSLYRIEQKLGRTFRELRPYPLFPLDKYFHKTVRNPIRPIGRPRLAVMPLPELDPLPQIA